MPLPREFRGRNATLHDMHMPDRRAGMRRPKPSTFMDGNRFGSREEKEAWMRAKQARKNEMKHQEKRKETGMSPQVDISNWPNRAQAAAQLGCSERSVDRLCEDKQLEFRMRQRPGVRPERVYNPDQIAASLPPPPSSLVRTSAVETVPPPTAELSELGDMDYSLLTQTIQLIVAEAIQNLPAPAPPQRFVNVAKASEILGLSQSCVRRMMREGKLQYLTDHNAWLTSRDALESFDPFAPVEKKGGKK